MKELLKRAKAVESSPERPEGFSTGMSLSATDSGRTYSEVFRMILAFMGIFGTVFSFVTSFDSGCSYLFAAAVCVVSWGLYSAAFLPKAPKYVGMGAAGATFLWLLYCLVKADMLIAGFKLITNRYLAAAMSEYAENPMFEVGLDLLDEGKCISLAVAFTAVLISLVVCVASVKSTNVVLVFLVTFPLLELALYFGLIPALPPYIMTVCCWAAMLACETAEISDSGNGRKTYRRTSSQSGFAAAVIFLSAFVIAFVFSAAAGYRRPESVDSARKSFARYMETFTWDKFTSDINYYLFAGKGGVIHDGQLGNTAKVEFTGDEMLRVTLPVTNSTVYLKGFTGTEYTGYRWLDETDGEPKLLTSMTSNEFLTGRIMPYVYGFGGMHLENVTVQNVGMSKSAKYLPANCAGMLEVNDTGRRFGVYFPEDRQWRENIMDNAAYISLEDTLAVDEAAMRSYAYSRCLDVPESFTAYEQVFDGYSGGYTDDDLSYIRNWLAVNCEYTLNAGRKPMGEDFAQWFVTENMKGSCTHFATTAALLCRSRGIPARYCEGYVIKASDMAELGDTGEEVMVKLSDCRAHAWIEVYIDGYGWLNYEMTPGYGNISFETGNLDDSSDTWETAASNVETEVTEQTGTSEGDAPMQTSEATVSETDENGFEMTVTVTSDEGSETTSVPAEGQAEEAAEDSGASETGLSESAVSDSDAAQTEGIDSDFTENGQNAGAGGIPDGMPDSADIQTTSEQSTLITDANGGGYAIVTETNGETSISYVGRADDADGGGDNGGGGKLSGKAKKAIVRVIVTLLSAVLIAVILVLRRRLLYLYRAKRIADDPDGAAKAMYKKLCRMAVSGFAGDKAKVSDIRAAVGNGDAEKLAEAVCVSEVFEETAVRMVTGNVLRARFGGGISVNEAQNGARAMNVLYDRMMSEHTDGLSPEAEKLYRFAAKWLCCSDRYIE